MKTSVKEWVEHFKINHPDLEFAFPVTENTTTNITFYNKTGQYGKELVYHAILLGHQACCGAMNGAYFYPRLKVDDALCKDMIEFTLWCVRYLGNGAVMYVSMGDVTGGTYYKQSNTILKELGHTGVNFANPRYGDNQNRLISWTCNVSKLKVVY